MTAHRGRVAIVTGAASGIGRAAAERLVAGGARVLAVDIDEAKLGWTKGVRDVESMRVDVTSEEENNAMVAQALGAFGQLNALILNAGAPTRGSLEDLPLEDFDRVMEINVRGVVLGMRAGISALADSKTEDAKGAIVVTASTSGLAADPGMWAYNTSKGAVVNLVRAAAIDLAARGIRVNGVCPGPVHTGMTARTRDSAPEKYDVMRRQIPLQRWGEPSEVAEVISFLASPAASFVTGALVPVDGGITANTGQFTPDPLG